MSTSFSVVYDSTSTPYAGQLALLTSNMLAAAERWGEYFTGVGSVEIEIEFSDLNGSNRAGGTSLWTSAVGTAGSLSILQQGMAHEIITGTDVNGSTPDVLVNIAPAYFLNELWLDPTPLDHTVAGPAGRTDAVSVFMHELGHALAFNGWRSWSTYLLPNGVNYESVFDSLVTVVGNLPYFNGANAMAVYGGPVPLTAGNLMHLGNASGPGSTLVPDLMNGVVFLRGTLYDISRLDIAVMQDIGIPVNPYVGFRTADAITGNAGANLLKGLEGNDTLDGGAGADTLEGGLGADLYLVDSAADVVTDVVGGGSDAVRATLGNAEVFTLGAELESLTLLGSADAGGTGNVLNNLMTGNTGGNSLSGMGDNDTLSGLAGNDTLNGGAGDDSMAGGDGNDLYVVDAALDRIEEASASGWDAVLSIANSYTLAADVESLTMRQDARSGTGNLQANLMQGSYFENTLAGGGGDDTLDGGHHADAMAGGAGNDIYYISRGDGAGTALGPGYEDVIVELPGSGIDTVVARGYFYVLESNVENLTLAGYSRRGFGNELDNLIQGSTFNNVLQGQSGNDTLSGGAGRDELEGGAGNDGFLFSLAPDAISNVDTILDFGVGVDRIQVDKDVFVGLAVGALAATAFASGPGMTAALDSADRFIYNTSTGDLYYDAGGSAGAAPVLMATLKGAPTLTAANFEVVL